MKKTVPFAFILTLSLLVCVFAFAGCASSQTETTSAAKTMTLEEVLQKSAADTVQNTYLPPQKKFMRAPLIWNR